MANGIKKTLTKVGKALSGEKPKAGVTETAGAGPALAAHSKDAKTKSATGQNRKAAGKSA